MYGMAMGKGDMVKSGFGTLQGMRRKHYVDCCGCEVRTHHGDLVAHGKTEKHRKYDSPFSTSHFVMLVSSVKMDTSVKVAS